MVPENCHLTLEKKVTIPDVVRTSCHSQIVQMYISYCKDLNFTPLGKNSLLKILTACAASQRTKLHGLDNIAAEGVEAFQSLHEFVNNLKKNLLFLQIFTMN